MSNWKQWPWKNIFIHFGWSLVLVGAACLTLAARHQKQIGKVKAVAFHIQGGEQQLFVDEQELKALMAYETQIKGKARHLIPLRRLEKAVEQNPWISRAQIFIDNQQVLQVVLQERQPVARIFDVNGASFYIDSTGFSLPLSDKTTARVPVFTGLEDAQKKDSLLYKDMAFLAQHLALDSFLQAQLAQVVILPQHQYEILPLVGNHSIRLGTTDDLKEKLSKLAAFYTGAWLQKGMLRYKTLDLRFRGQVVGIRSDWKPPVFSDSITISTPEIR